jgi:diguanylate cyclase (GGDEF)-like protein
MAFYAIEKEIKYNVENLNSLRLIGVQTVEFKKTQGNDRRRLATLIAKNKIQELSIEKQRLNEMIYTLGIAIISLVLIISATMIRRLFKEKKRLSNLANTDHLTKALNRRAIMNLGVVELSRCHNENQPFTVAVADIDFFKNINDTFGHDTGDEVLKYFALCSKNIIRNTEYFGRIGGEEWLFIMPNSGKELATTLFKRLSSALANINDIINIGDNPLTFSLGIAEACANENLKDIVIRADEKLYLAKNNGRNQAMY